MFFIVNDKLNIRQGCEKSHRQFFRVRHGPYSGFQVWVLQSFLFAFVEPCYISKAEVTTIKIIFQLSLSHCYSKLKFKFVVCLSHEGFQHRFCKQFVVSKICLDHQVLCQGLCFVHRFHKVCDFPFCFSTPALLMFSKINLDGIYNIFEKNSFSQ